MKPSVGRIVHYVSYGTPSGEYPPACRAAIITEADPGGDVHETCLAVLNPTGLFFNLRVTYHEGEPAKPGTTWALQCGGLDYRGGTWHWPARIPD